MTNSLSVGLRRVLVLAVATAFLSSCATMQKIQGDPVVCGVIGTVVGGVAFGFLGAALAANGSPAAFPAIVGATLGAGLGGWGGYKICKEPAFGEGEKARAKPAATMEPAAAEEPASEAAEPTAEEPDPGTE